MPALARLPHAVLFDMDGLMLDTEPLAVRAWDEAAQAMGVTFDAAIARRMIGRNFHDCTALLHAESPAGYPVEAVLGRWHDAYDAIVLREGLAVKAGVFLLLDHLDAHGIPRAVATSTRRVRAEAKLRQSALLSRFGAVVGGDEVARGKPAPDIYLEAARRLGVTASACLVLEDSDAGVRGALAAGMTPIMVPDLLPPAADLLAQGVIVHASLTDVAAWLAQLAATGIDASAVR